MTNNIDNAGHNIPYQMRKNTGIQAGWAVLDDILRMGVSKWAIKNALSCEWTTVRKWQKRSSAPNYEHYQNLVTLRDKTKAEIRHLEEMREKYRMI